MRFYQRWAKWALFNFLILAAVGILLRYKILFPLPVVEQKHLLHGHSHFAFAGWVGLALYISIIYLLKPSEKLLKQFSWLLLTQQISSYGMLFTFPFMGYAAASIAFSTVSVLVSYVFAWITIKEIRSQNEKHTESKWLITALLCNVVSSFGTFVLAYLMISKNLQQEWYFGSVYFFLHFQYNGWFLFTIGALFISFSNQGMKLIDDNLLNRIYYLLLIALVPSWFLSLMWMRIPVWMYNVAIAGAAIQLIALWLFMKYIWMDRKQLLILLNPVVKWFWFIAGAAFTLKIIMQALSAIPQLNTYAFGLRAIVIGFLHLVLLVFISIFLVGYFLQQNFVSTKLHSAKKGAWVFVCGVLLNELVLMLQGLRAMQNETLAYANYFLLVTAVLIFSGLTLLLIGNRQSKHPRFS